MIGLYFQVIESYKIIKLELNCKLSLFFLAFLVWEVSMLETGERVIKGLIQLWILPINLPNKVFRPMQ